MKWKFKTFILIYGILVIVGLGYLCNYVWASLEQYQESYDAEYKNSNPQFAMDEFMNELDMDYVLGMVESHEKVKVTTFEDMDCIKEMYKKDCGSGKFSYVEDKDKSDKDKKIYYVMTEDYEPILSVSVVSTDRTEEFGFNVWEVKDITLEKFYEPTYSATIRVPVDSVVTVNGITLVPGQGCTYYDDVNYDSKFATEVIKFTGKYTTYRYIQTEKLYNEPKIEVVDEGKTLAYNTTEDGVMDYEVFASEEFINNVTGAVITAEAVYADYIARYKELEEVVQHIVPNTVFAKETNDAQAFIIFIVRPKSVTYSDWDISEVKTYGSNMFQCKLSYTQYVSYGYKVMEYKSVKHALFKYENGQWLIAYQKNYENR
ncbi:MAG: hypothetical protein E7266_02695 [Lachnospiraceae bacterium]|nr:hypothetical protein [Lachnospiraceae bacterium]